MKQVPDVSVVGLVVSVLTVLNVSVVIGVVVAMLLVDTEALVPVVDKGILAVVPDTVLEAVGIIVDAVTDRYFESYIILRIDQQHC